MIQARRQSTGRSLCAKGFVDGGERTDRESLLLFGISGNVGGTQRRVGSRVTAARQVE